MHIISLLGLPGSGKGAIGSKLSELEGIRHISIGDALRQRRSEGAYQDQHDILRCLDEGELLPKTVIVPLIIEMLHECESAKVKIVFLDGFPRCLDQGFDFEAKYQKFDVILCLECSTELAQERYLSRKHPGRLLDDISLFRKRVNEYLEKIQQIKEYYMAIGKWLQVSSAHPVDMTLANVISELKMLGYLC